MSAQLGVQSPDAQSPSYKADPVAYQKWWQQGIGREKFRASLAKYQAKHPERRRAQWTVANALTAGKIAKGTCAVAGSECRGRIEGHHEDYSKPLEVQWLCRKHHRQADDRRREREQEAA